MATHASDRIRVYFETDKASAIDDLPTLSAAALLAIGGIGPARLNLIATAVATHASIPTEA